MGIKRFVLSGIMLFIFISIVSCSKNPAENDPANDPTSPQGANNPPTVNLTGDPTSGGAPLVVQFNASAQDSDGSIVKYEWDFDGNDAFDSTTTAGTLSYTYSNYDTCGAKVRVTDDDGATAEATTSICIAAKASFTPSGTPGSNSVYISQVVANVDEVILNINAKEVTNVHGIAIEITFDESKVSFVSALEGDFLGQGGTNTLFNAGLEQGNNGVLLIAVNRTETTVGVDGDGLLASIVLKSLTTHPNTPFDFNIANSALKLPSGGGSISGVTWVGGNVSYQ